MSLYGVDIDSPELTSLDRFSRRMDMEVQSRDGSKLVHIKQVSLCRNTEVESLGDLGR